MPTRAPTQEQIQGCARNAYAMPPRAYAPQLNCLRGHDAVPFLYKSLIPRKKRCPHEDAFWLYTNMCTLVHIDIVTTTGLLHRTLQGTQKNRTHIALPGLRSVCLSGVTSWSLKPVTSEASRSRGAVVVGGVRVSTVAEKGKPFVVITYWKTKGKQDACKKQCSLALCLF